MEENKTFKKLIIFDDDEDILLICTYLLEEKGWQVYTFTDTHDMVERVDKIRPDIILMDNWIPDSGGIVATQELKNNEELKNIPVIYFSANLEIASLAAHAGANSYIAKPFDIDHLDSIIDSLMSKLHG